MGEQGHSGNQHLKLGLVPSAILGRDLFLPWKLLHQGQLDHFLNSHNTSAVDFSRSQDECPGLQTVPHKTEQIVLSFEHFVLQRALNKEQRKGTVGVTDAAEVWKEWLYS